ncbi:glycosyltransferase [Quadrisphaera sp. DSM 44207]|uniref:glycosyltransferase n=1 Tax=Quadrisphaera sp. DSM 44207 TaxID=1881057 RepID=UPI00088740AE|nr:glycosyltransferase [Quadrisphaera sp. DSM 44207]SDQ66849.1 Glycosyltransferase like family 2 [Quadrisphaera sp. DSM 44207]
MLGGAAHAAGLVLPAVFPLAHARTEHGPSCGPVQTIDVVIAAYLESTVIGAAVRRLRRDLARYGGGRVVVVASDRATFDAAHEADVRLLQPRSGKASAINAGVETCSADVVVLTDANCEIRPENWPDLVREALCRGVGLLSANKTEEAGEGLYWRYERTVKQLASHRTGCLAVVGEFLALRRRDFRRIPTTAVNDDLWLAIDVGARGGRVETHPAIVTTEPAAPPEEQWGRRTRIMAGQLELMRQQRGQLLRTAAGRHLLVHKWYRSTVGAGAFWVATAAATALLPAPLRLPVLGSLASAVRDYRAGTRRSRFLPSSAVSYAGMQAVPLEVARQRVLRGLRRVPEPAQHHLWRKVTR